MDTKEELYLEYARCINMCKGTEVKPWECVLMKLADGFSLYRRENMHLAFDGDPKNYKFAIFLLEGKPVFPGDILYLNGDGLQYEVYKNGYIPKDEVSDAFIKADWQNFLCLSRHTWSWSPPQPQEYVINVQFGWTGTPGQAQKQTFAVNGVAMPSPISRGVTAANAVSIRSAGFVEYFGFENNVDADLVVLEFIKILRAAERSKS